MRSNRLSKSRKGNLAIALISLLLNSCASPSREETGGMVFMAAPLALLIGMGIQTILVKRWKKIWPELEFDWRPSKILLALLFAMAIIFSKQGLSYLEWMGPVMALWIFGTAFLSALFITLRIWIHFAPTSALKWSPVAAMLLNVFPALPMVLNWGGTENLDELAFFSWYFLSTASFDIPPGIVPLALLSLLAIEVSIRTGNQDNDHGSRS